MAEFLDLTGTRTFLNKLRAKMDAELDKTDWRQDGDTFKFGKVYKNVSPFVLIKGVNSVDNISVNTDTKVVTIPSGITQVTVSGGYSTVSGGA